MSQEKKDISFSVIVRNSDPIVNCHRVHGVNIMPGVCFLDMMYRALKTMGYAIEQIVMQNILFKQPVITTDNYDRKIIATISKVNDHLQIKASSKKIKEEIEIDKDIEENFECEIHIEVHQPRRNEIDIRDLLKTAEETVSMEDIYQFTRNLNIVHYDFMKGYGELHIGQNYLLTHLRLNESALEYLDHFIFHPVLLDASTLIPFYYYSRKSNNEKPYIPIFIKSFRIFEKIKGECYVYLEKPERKDDFSDILSSNYSIYDDSGKQVAAFSELTGKKIRSEEGLERTNNDPLEARNKIKTPLEASTVDECLINENLTAHSLIIQIITKHNTGLAEKINTKANFYELGLDSVQLLQIVQELEKNLKTKLYPTLLFEYQTIDELSNFLEKEYSLFFNTDSDHSTAIEPTHDAHDTVEKTPEDNRKELISFTSEWQEAPTEESTKDTPKSIFIFDENDHLKNSINTITDNSTTQVVLIKPGLHFREVSNDVYEINFNSSTDYNLLIKDLFLKFKSPKKIVYKFNLESDNLTYKETDTTLSRGIYSLFHLCKSIMSADSKEYINLFCFFSGKDKLSNPYYSAIAGFSKTLSLENYRLTCKTVITPISIEKDIKQLANLIRKEVTTEDKNFEILYHTNNARFVKKYREFKMNENANAYTFPFRENGVYIITGGAGGLGLIFAEWLTNKGKCTIYLIGRSPLNEEKKKKFIPITATGSEVNYINCDVSKPKEVKSSLLMIKQKHNHINGLIHCAGVIRDSFILKKTVEEMHAVFVPKIHGTLLLDQFLAEEKLDFFIMTSSLSAVTGNVGQSDYAYANAFMDGFAALRNKKVKDGTRFGKTISVNYPLWKNGGMKIDKMMLDDLEEMGFSMLETTDGLNIIDRGFDDIEYNVALISGNKAKIRHLMGMDEKTLINENNRESEINDKENITINLLGNYDCFFNKAEINRFWQQTTTKYTSSLNTISEEDKNSAINIPDKVSHMLINTQNDLELETFMCGSGKTVLFIPPFGMTARIWSYQLMELSTKYKIIIINKPGHGLSKVKDNLSIEELSNGISLVLKRLEVDEKVNLVGSSFGGLIAQQFAIDFPDQVASLTLIGSFSRFSPEFISLPKEEAMAKFPEVLKKELDNISNDSTRSESQIKEIRSFIYRSLSITSVPNTEKFNLLKFSTHEKLYKISAPCLLIVGKNDLFRDSLFCADENDFMMSHLTHAELYQVAEAGHFPYVTHWQQINEKINSFMDSAGEK